MEWVHEVLVEGDASVAGVAELLRRLDAVAARAPGTRFLLDETGFIEELVRLVGGREPVHVPEAVARAIVRGAAVLGRVSGPAAALGRRIDMLWWGQGQVAGWLADRWTAPLGHEAWRRLRE